jgi:hypothetical protein
MVKTGVLETEWGWEKNEQAMCPGNRGDCNSILRCEGTTIFGTTFRRKNLGILIEKQAL